MEIEATRNEHKYNIGPACEHYLEWRERGETFIDCGLGCMDEDKVCQCHRALELRDRQHNELPSGELEKVAVNIYELEKQATPAPWNFAYAGASHVPDPLERRYHPQGQVVTILDVPWPNNMTRIEWEANKKLVAHCRRNYTRALAALKELVEVHSTPQEPCVASRAVERAAALIKELENVE